MGRHPADRSDVFPELRPENLPARQQHPGQRPDRGRVAGSTWPAAATAAISTCARSTTTAFPKPTRRAKFRVIHPVIDYSYVFGQPVFGGELSYQTNLTSLSRANADFNPISTNGLANGLCTFTNADPAAKIPANCLLRGVPGAYTRASGEAHWKRTHHRSLRADLDAVRQAAGGRGAGFGHQHSRRLELHHARRLHRVPRHADGRAGVPLSVHQRALLGHADHRADRADHRAAERAQRRQAAERRLRKV